MCTSAATHLAAAFEIFGKHGTRARHLRSATARALGPVLAAADRPAQARGMLEVALRSAANDVSMRAGIMADSAGHARGVERIHALTSSLRERARALHREHPLLQQALAALLAALRDAGQAEQAAAYQRQFSCTHGPVLEVG